MAWILMGNINSLRTFAQPYKMVYIIFYYTHDKVFEKIDGGGRV